MKKTLTLPPLNIEQLVRDLLDLDHEWWRAECEIIPGYMPPYPREDTRPACVVRYKFVDKRDGEAGCFLRHSGGARQGFFWDIYGDDLLRPELALVALAQAPTPPPLMGTYFCQKFSIPLRPRKEEP